MVLIYFKVLRDLGRSKNVGLWKIKISKTRRPVEDKFVILLLVLEESSKFVIIKHQEIKIIEW